MASNYKNPSQWCAPGTPANEARNIYDAIVRKRNLPENEKRIDGIRSKLLSIKNDLASMREMVEKMKAQKGAETLKSGMRDGFLAEIRSRIDKLDVNAWVVAKSMEGGKTGLEQLLHETALECDRLIGALKEMRAAENTEQKKSCKA